MKRYYVTVNGKRYEVEVEEVKGNFEPKPMEAQMASAPVAQNAQPAVQAPTPAPAPVAVVEAAPAQEASKASQTPASSGSLDDGEKIECPMPGTIVGVNVKNGDTVKKGEVMFILEAMKMENEIMAPRDCKMLSVNVSKGASVNTGDLLGIIE